MTTPSFDLEALRALVEKMTPGPWCVDDHIVTPGDTPEEWHIYEQCEDDPPLATLSYIDAEANAAGIVALRNAFPALLAVAEAAIALNLPDEPGGWQPEFRAKAALRAALARLGEGK